jgi:hypothetical protein
LKLEQDLPEQSLSMKVDTIYKLVGKLAKSSSHRNRTNSGSSTTSMENGDNSSSGGGVNSLLSEGKFPVEALTEFLAKMGGLDLDTLTRMCNIMVTEQVLHLVAPPNTSASSNPRLD